MGGVTQQSATNWGTIDIEGVEPSRYRTRESALPGTLSRHTWRPPADLAAKLPFDFSLTFHCLTGSNGNRHFAPALPVANFVIQAAHGGSALLVREFGLDAEQCDGYRVNQLLYQKAHGLRSHMSRKFTREADLYITGAGQVDQGHRYVLPDDLGLDAVGQGTPWTPRDVLDRGRSEAERHGNRPDDVAAHIRLGLLAGAQLNPIEPTGLSERESLSLVRTALFGLDPSVKSLDPVVVARVTERLLDLLRRYLDGDADSFDRRFLRSDNDLVHAIAKRKKGGGCVPREVVRQVLLQRVFESFQSVGNCVHFQMLAFARAFPDSLNADELAMLKAVYAKRSHLGGLPLVLLHDRFEFLREAILDLLEAPADAGRIGVLLRMMNYYTEMVDRIREADRQKKKRRLGNSTGKHSSQLEQTTAPLPSRPTSAHQRSKDGSDQYSATQPRQISPKAEDDPFQQIVAAWRKSQRATCQCDSTDHWHAVLANAQVSEGMVVIDDECRTCGHFEVTRITRERFKAIGSKIRNSS